MASLSPPLPDGVCLLASVCNTTPNAVPFALWVARADQQYVVDLSDVLGKPGDFGLTGLAWKDGTLYAAVQGDGDPRLLRLNGALTPTGALSAPAFSDLHSLLMTDQGLLVCATGTNTLLRLDFTSRAVSVLCRGTERIHLNSACFDEDALLLCVHRLKSEDRGLASGGVLDSTARRMIVPGLGLPHSLMPHRDGFLVLDSVGARVIRFDRGGVRAERALSGFLRGATTIGDTLFVASSTLRYVSRRQPGVSPARGLWQLMTERVRIFALDAETLAPLWSFEPVVPGFEIYELLAVGAGAIAPAEERLLQPDRGAIAHLFYEATKLAGAAQRARQQ